MPRVKIDHIVSFSSEDPEHPASNLLLVEESSHRWSALPGSGDAVVVLGLPRAVQITRIVAATHGTAFLEILVGRSEAPNDAYKVLVPRCVVCSPALSRREDVSGPRLRSFTADQLDSHVRGQRFDRVKVVCSQPYNKHCQLGLSFLHVFEGGEEVRAGAGVLGSLLSDEGDEDAYRPGDLFAKHMMAKNTSTESQIKQATSLALKNIPDSSTKLVKTPISKDHSKHRQSHSQTSNIKQRNDVLYEKEDDNPNEKIDKVVNRHKEEKRDESNKKESATQINKKTDLKKNNDTKDIEATTSDSNKPYNKKHSKNTFEDSVSKKLGNEKEKERDRKEKDERNRHNSLKTESSHSKHENNVVKETVSNKRPGSPKDSTKQVPKRPRKSPLTGVVFVLSGYVNPERAALRDMAVALGARYQNYWSDQCTHLICAFPNTPKLREMRQSKATAVAVSADWLKRCHGDQALVSTAPYHIAGVNDPVRPDTHDSSTECDTDDEIEKVMKTKQLAPSQPEEPSTARTEHADRQTNEHADRQTNEDKEQLTMAKTNSPSPELTEYDLDTDVEENYNESPRAGRIPRLPAMFGGMSFRVDPAVERAGFDSRLLARYVLAYGGTVVPMDEETMGEDPILLSCERGEGKVRPDWVWSCHSEKRLVERVGYTT